MLDKCSLKQPCLTQHSRFFPIKDSAEAEDSSEGFLVGYSNKERSVFVPNCVINSWKKKLGESVHYRCPDTLTHLCLQIPGTCGDPMWCSSPRDDRFGLTRKHSLFLIMHWSHMGAWFSTAQNRSWPRCGLPALMVLCIPDRITARNRFFSSLKTVYFGHLSSTLRDVFISQNV